MTDGAAAGPATTRGSELRLTDVRKVYSGQVAVDGVSLDVHPGEFMTLLGPSGSGKTTTLNIISGFDETTSGSLQIDGVVMDDVPARKRGIGMVFQNYALFPHMTVEQNIAFPLQQRKIPKAQRRDRVRHAIETVRLEGFETRLPAQLSGGQQQRVALARAIVFEPGLLLMDEPLGALDKSLRESMQLEIRRIHREAGSTVVFVTHDQEEALALSDRIAVFNKGRIEQVGTGEDLYQRPKTLFVAKFLGDSTLIDGIVAAEGGRAAILSEMGLLPAETGGLSGSVTIVIRPERSRLLEPDGPVPSGLRAVDATVIEDIYLGHDRKLRVQLPGGTIGIVRESGGQMSRFSIGDATRFAWSVADAVVLPAD